MFTIAGEHPVRDGAAPIDAAGILARLERASGETPAHQRRGRPRRPRRRGRTARRGRSAESIRAAALASVPQLGEPQLQLLRRVGMVDPASLDDYLAHRGYAALRDGPGMGPEAVIREVTDSKLVGRGGAAFPTGRKWAAVATQAAQPHYVVCNADESEPGTFKDRVLMELDPFAVVESMTIEGFATGAATGYLYIRGEYPLAESRIRGAIDAARAAGYLGAVGRRLGVRLRHRGPARRRGVHLRRGDGALRIDRGQARRAAQQAAVPGRGRAVRQADGGQQRGDARQRSHDHRRRRRRASPTVGYRRLDRPEALLPVGQRRASGRVRGAVRDDAARS